MAFGVGNYVKIFEVEVQDNYTVCSIASSRKNRQTDKYETDFSSKFVRFYGNAHKQRPLKGQRIKLVDCDVRTCYVKDGQTVYFKNPQFRVFGYELQDSNGSSKKSEDNMTALDDLESQLPF